MKKNLTKLLIVILIAGQAQTALPYNWDMFNQSTSHLLSNTYNILSNPFAQKICICLAGASLAVHSYNMQQELNSLKTATDKQKQEESAQKENVEEKFKAMKKKIKVLEKFKAKIKFERLISYFMKQSIEQTEDSMKNNAKINNFNTNNPGFIIQPQQSNLMVFTDGKKNIPGLQVALYEKSEHNPSGRSDNHIMAYVVLNKGTNEWSKIKRVKN
ncbi:MAG: hypothetical protein WC707_02990 [Candidatus Babeliaceae bacterium]|jgi:hypothetical protein